jgi:hypothetical protein
MAFHAIVCIRDEDDVVNEILNGFLEWADEIYVFDTGSVDNTWEIVNELSNKDHRIHPVETRSIWFSDAYRGYCFEKIRQKIKNNDWFIRADSDEIYHVAPPVFAANFLRKCETCVYHQYFDFRLTFEEAERLSTVDQINIERKQSIADRRRYFTLGTYYEPRMAKYRSSMSWPSKNTFPQNAGYVSRKRMPIRHYPNRDPRQLQKRMKIRQIMTSSSANKNAFTARHHWRLEDWKQHLVMPGGDGVKKWETDADLIYDNESLHLGSPQKRMTQRLIHSLLLPILDNYNQQTAKTDKFIPVEISQQVQAMIRSAII